MRTMRWSPMVLAAVLAVGALGGCGSDDAATPPADPSTCRAVGGDAFTIVAKNMAFEDACLTVAPGTYDVTFDNDDAGTGHDLHITGNGIDARTPLTVGTDSHSVPVDLTVPGTYRFTCDPHPEMVGSIVVTAPPAATTTVPASDPPATSTTEAAS